MIKAERKYRYNEVRLCTSFSETPSMEICTDVPYSLDTMSGLWVSGLVALNSRIVDDEFSLIFCGEAQPDL